VVTRKPCRLRLKPYAAGFTLLEVMVAMAVLAVSMTSLMTSQMQNLRATRHAQQLTAISFLAEYQLIETEYIVRKEGGWVLEDKYYEGIFADQGWPEIRYKCLVDFILIPEYSQLRAAKDETKRATREASGDSSSMYYQSAGDKAFTALGMVWPVVKQAIERSIRKVKCTVFWKDGTIPNEYSIYTFWADPEKLKTIPGLGGEAKEGDEDEKGGEKPGGGGEKPGGAQGATGGAAGGSSTGVSGPGRGAMTGGGIKQ
jgi:prepilin-type N-terminal cleavage/methylation domain-containing protein